jgi:CO/xanthine dehydrogenase Mo-binding subunit
MTARTARGARRAYLTGAEHCRYDNPTLGQELMIDRLADVFGINQRELQLTV